MGMPSIDFLDAQPSAEVTLRLSMEPLTGD